MLPTDIVLPRFINGVTILGPDLFAVDCEGRLLTPTASVFPLHRILVTGMGIHAMQAALVVELLRKNHLFSENRDITCEEERAVYNDAVSLIIQNGTILIRSDPEDMEQIFAADDFLQLLVPKQRIEFTGVHLSEVRKTLRLRGESWRIAPQPHTQEDIARSIQSSRVRVGTGTNYYQSAATGGRFLSYEEFQRIRPLMRENRKEALARLQEIVRLTGLVNNKWVPELSFFTQPERDLPIDILENLLDVFNDSGSTGSMEEMETLFDRFAGSFAEAAGPELLNDNEKCTPWRTTLFCRLFDIDEGIMEEWTLGLSPEFHLNVRWLPGARILEGELLFEPDAEARVRGIITHYRRMHSDLVAINVGRVESAQTTRDRTGEERQVYLVSLCFRGREEIQLVRLVKWDIIHRLKKGLPGGQAIAETLDYRDYIFDRLKSFSALEIPIPFYTEIQFSEEVECLGCIPVFLIARPYVSGMATEKIPLAHYSQPEFVIRLAGLLGMAAAVTLIMGRACPRTGRLFFDDGDEVIQLDEGGLPKRLVITETTGSFNDYSTPVGTRLPCCLKRLALHLEKARSMGNDRESLVAAMGAFAEGMVSEIQRMQQLLIERSTHIRSLFADRSTEPGGIRTRWEAILNRLQSTNTTELLSQCEEARSQLHPTSTLSPWH